MRSRRIDAALGHVGERRRHQRVAQRLRDLLRERRDPGVVLAERHVRPVLLGAADGHDDRRLARRDLRAQLGPRQIVEEDRRGRRRVRGHREHHEPARRNHLREARHQRLPPPGHFLAELNGLPRLAQLEVEHLDAERERHREVDVALRDVQVEAFADQRDAHQDQEREREHLDRRVLVDELADRLRGEHHDAHRDDDREHHHRNVAHHPHCGDDRIEREDDVDHRDLHERAVEAGGGTAAMPFVAGALERRVDLHHGLREQEQPAADQDQVAPRDVGRVDRDQRIGEAHHPRERQKQADPHQHREGEPDQSRPLALLGRQAGDEDRDEDDVVDAQDDFERRQAQQRRPGFGRGQPLHGTSSGCWRPVSLVDATCR